MRKKPVFMTMIQKVKFANYVTENYKSSGLDNSKFALQASKALGFKIENDQVRYMREQFNIEPNRPQRLDKPLQWADLLHRIEVLEQQVSHLMRDRPYISGLAGFELPKVTCSDVNREQFSAQR